MEWLRCVDWKLILILIKVNRDYKVLKKNIIDKDGVDEKILY